MSNQAAVARTPGAKRAGTGEYVFDLAKINKIKGGPDYSSVEGGCVEGDRMIVALMRMPVLSSFLAAKGTQLRGLAVNEIGRASCRERVSIDV